MSVYRTEYRLGTRDVNRDDRLRTSVMFELLQNAAEQQNEILDLGQAAMQKAGRFWAVVRQRAEIARMPGFGEVITLETWPGQPRHALFPRYYRILTASGQTLVSVSSLWAVVRLDSRTMEFPEEAEFHTASLITGNETALPRPIQCVREGSPDRFTVPFSCIDRNGHMNNARYFDLAEDGASAAAEGKELLEVAAEYNFEARLGERICLYRSESGGQCTVSGRSGGKRLFSVSLQYRE